jgi:hypothetical protein
MKRTDTKYLMGVQQLRTLLADLVEGYWILEIEGVRLSRLRTLYFDTADLALYTSHHMGRAERFKVRSRSYIDSAISFLEVKRKLRNLETVKSRIPTEAALASLTPEANQFVNALTSLDGRSLQPALWSEFSRITLVSKHRQEKLTFDVNLRFRSSDSHASLGGVVVAELKQDKMSRDSELIARIQALGIRPTPFSKYCVGVAMLYPGVKHNQFKPVLRKVEDIMRGDGDE